MWKDNLEHDDKLRNEGAVNLCETMKEVLDSFLAAHERAKKDKRELRSIKESILASMGPKELKLVRAFVESFDNDLSGYDHTKYRDRKMF